MQSADRGERVAGEEEAIEASSHGGVGSISSMPSHGSRANYVCTPQLPSKRAALPLAERLSRFLRCRCLRADAGEGERLYTLTVCYQQHRWARLFGLSTTSQVSRIHPLIPRTGL